MNRARPSSRFLLALLACLLSGMASAELVGFTGFPIGGALGFSPVTHRGMVSSITPIALPAANARQVNEKLVRRNRPVITAYRSTEESGRRGWVGWLSNLRSDVPRQQVADAVDRVIRDARNDETQIR